MTGHTYEFGEFRFVPSARELWKNGQRVELPRRTFECIGHLLEHRDRAVGRDELVAAVFGRPDVSDAQLGQIVLRSRRALDDDGNVQRAIRTIPGFGYRWVAEVRLCPEPASVAAAPAPAPTPVPLPAPAPRPPFAIAALLLAALALASALAWHGRNPAPAPETAAAPMLSADGVLVLPIEVEGLREDGWMRLGAMDLIADRLREAGLAVPPSEDVLALTRTEAGVERLRELTSARLIVSGKAARGAKGWKIELAARPAQGIATPASFEDADAIRAARGASDLLLAALGRRLPENLERDATLDETLQRARAAMLSNELDTARAILTGSPRLAERPAQLDFRLAQVDFRAGELARAEATLDAVLAHPDAQADATFRAQVLASRGATRMRRGAFADGGRDYAAALALLGPDADPLLRGQALDGRGNSHVAGHRFDEALADFGAARVALESAGDALGVARVDANLGMLELYRGRPAEALGYLAAAAERFESFGALRPLLLTLTGRVEAELALLRRDEALATVERAWALRERITDPDQFTDQRLNRAQAFIGAGRHAEARELLDAAGRSLPAGNAVLTARARALGAELAMRQSRWADAAENARRALDEWPDAGADGDRAWVVLILQRALLALGRSEAAGELLDRRRTPPEYPDERPGGVAEALAMAEWTAHRREPADPWFRFAAASADRRGVPAEIVAVAQSYGPLLLDAGRLDEAGAVVGRIAPWAGRDFDCALLQLRLFHALGQHDAWLGALRQAQALAGERAIPAALATLDRPSRVQLSSRD